MKVLKDILTAWYAFVIFLTIQFIYSLVETCRHYYVNGYWSDHTTDHFTALVWCTTLILLWRHGFYAQWYTWLRRIKSKEAPQVGRQLVYNIMEGDGYASFTVLVRRKGDTPMRRRNDTPMRKWEDDDE